METGMVPLEGGFSGETFLATAGDQRSVARIYRPGRRPANAPEVDAAVLRLVRGLLPVPEVLEVRRGDPEGGVPGLLVTSFLPGERLDLLLAGLDDGGSARVGRQLGELLARLSHMAQPFPGEFVDDTLTIRPFSFGLGEWADRLGLSLPGLPGLLEWADELNERTSRTCLVHSDFNPKNLLVDPETLEVTGLLDWEFAHAGSPYADLGNLLRFEDTHRLRAEVLDRYACLVPDAPSDLEERAQAADLFALVELAARAGQNPVADRAATRLRTLAASYA